MGTDEALSERPTQAIGSAKYLKHEGLGPRPSIQKCNSSFLTCELWTVSCPLAFGGAVQVSSKRQTDGQTYRQASQCRA